MSIQKIFSRLREYASRPFRLDLRSLALFRVGLGTLIILDLINRGLYLRAHYTDVGVMPRKALLDTMWNPQWMSLHMLSGTALVQAIMFVIAGLVAVGLIVGWRTRVMTVISWVLLISLQARNPLVLQGGDIAFRLLAFWAMFLPLGARWSVDAALADESDVEAQNAPPDESPDPDEEPFEVTEGFLSMGTIAFVAQIVSVYIFTALLKTGDPWLEHYTSVYYALALDQFTTPIGDFLFTQEWLFVPLTIVTIWLELVGWVLLFIPVYSVFFRLAAILLFVGMHLGFAACMQLGLFSYIMAVGWLTLTPGWVWDGIAARFESDGTGYVLRTSDPDGLRAKLGQILATLVFLPNLEVETVDAPDHRVELLTPEDERHTGWDIGVALVDASPIFSPLSAVLAFGPVRKAGRFVVGLWVDGRSGAATERLLARRPLIIRPSIVGSILAAAALSLCLAWNIDTLPHQYTLGAKYNPPSWVRKATIYPRLDQQWNMFSPFPLKDDGWYVIPAELKNGKKVDLFRNGASPIKWSKPDDVSATYPNQRWRKYMMNLWMSKFSNQRLYYGKWLCRSWNSSHSGGETLMTFKIYFMKERTPDPFEDPEKKEVRNWDKYIKPEKVQLWKHHCFEAPNDKGNDAADANPADIADTLLDNDVFQPLKQRKNQ